MESGKKISKNLLIISLCYFITFIFTFIIQKLFVNNLGAELLGLKSLLFSVFNLISLINIGFDESVLYSLYKPVVNNDNNLVFSILNYFKKIYRITSLLILIVSILVIPILINTYGITPVKNINILLSFVIIVFFNLFDYILGYKRVILIAHQLEYKINILPLFSNIILDIFQIICLYIFKSFYIFLLIFGLKIFFRNLIINIYTIKKYKINKQNLISLPLELKSIINKNAFSLLYHKIGAALVFNVDSILISKIVGVFMLGIYNNYVLIYTTLDRIIGIIYISIRAAFGSLVAKSDDSKETLKYYNIIFYISVYLAIFTSICIYFLSEPFINDWLGKKFCLDSISVLIISITFYFSILRRPTDIVKKAYGIYKQDKYKAIIEGLTNLILSILFGIKYGFNGILFATMLCRIFIPSIVEPYVVYKYGFKKSIKKYSYRFIYYLIIYLIIYTVNNIILNIILIDNNILLFFIRLFIIFNSSIFIFILMTIRSEEFLYVKVFIINKINSFRRRKDRNV